MDGVADPWVTLTFAAVVVIAAVQWVATLQHHSEPNAAVVAVAEVAAPGQKKGGSGGKLFTNVPVDVG